MSVNPTSALIARNMREDALLQNVIRMAKLFGWTVYHARPAMNRSGRWSTPTQGDIGFPDIAMVRNGRVIFAELKSMRGRLSPEQHNWLAELSKSVACETYTWRPTDWLGGQIEGVLR